MRVWAEVTHLVPFEVEVEDWELEDFQGIKAETSDDVMNLLYRNGGLADEILYSMPARQAGLIDACELEVRSVDIKDVEVLA